jgi:hypothetical protein
MRAFSTQSDGSVSLDQFQSNYAGPTTTTDNTGLLLARLRHRNLLAGRPSGQSGDRHNPAVSGTVGLLHGMAYPGTIAAATLLSAPTRVKSLSLAPGIGGFLLLRRIRARTS